MWVVGSVLSIAYSGGVPFLLRISIEGNSPNLFSGCTSCCLPSCARTLNFLWVTGFPPRRSKSNISWPMSESRAKRRQSATPAAAAGNVVSWCESELLMFLKLPARGTECHTMPNNTRYNLKTLESYTAWL